MNDMILILNYSDEFAVEAAKRLRGERVFCKIISGTTTAAQIAEIAPRGLVLCGEPKSAAGVFDAEILKLDIPVLALGHAAHMLIAAMGGNGFSAYGLCHLGDYEATVFSQYSHNRRFGEMFVRGEPYTELAEGYDTVKALCALADRYHVDLPIGRAVYAVLYDGAQPKEQMNQLFTRSLKREFDI